MDDKMIDLDLNSHILHNGMIRINLSKFPKPPKVGDNILIVDGEDSFMVELVVITKSEAICEIMPL